MSKLYALLVGIDAYPPGVRSLAGCVNDVGRYKGYLTDRFDPASLAIEMLTDADATRDNVIAQFRRHLGRAGEGDVALFQYAGHGAQSIAAPEFIEFAPDGKEEGLVCHDSRLPGKFDLADKELAVLIAEVAAKNPHVTVILDACHTGSATRSAEAIAGDIERFEKPAPGKREIGHYLDEYYLRQSQAKALSIPTARHILLAACDRTQTAKERQGAGIFSGALIEVLEKSGGTLSYAELFVRCRAAVRLRAASQDPQFEAIGAFNGQAGFLGAATTRPRRLYRAAFSADAGWAVNCGAVQGAPTDPAKPAGFALYPEDAPADAAPIGTATTVRVGPNQSNLALGFSNPPGVMAYAAELTSLPVAPLLVGFAGTDAQRAALEAAIAADQSAGVALADAAAATDYAIAPVDDVLWVRHRPSGQPLEGVRVDPADPAGTAGSLLSILKTIAQWQRALALQNGASKMDRATVDIVFVETLPDGSTRDHPPGEIVLAYTRAGDAWQRIRGRLKVRNRGTQPLHLSLVYCAPNYQIRPYRNEPLGIADPAAPGGGWLTLLGDADNETFSLKDGVDVAVESFKLIVSTEPVDDFLLAQPPLGIGTTRGSSERNFDAVDPPRSTVLRDEWFTALFRLKIVRQVTAVGPADAVLAGGAVTVLEHPRVTAGLALTPAEGATRSAGDPDFHRAFERLGMTLVDFGDGTRGAAANVLELTDIANAESLAETPLQIALKLPLAADETLVALAFDGEFVRLAGDAHKEADGRVLVSIDRIPAPAEASRSLFGALKLYFFKTALKQANVNLLRWVDYRADGGFERQKFGVADKVAAAGTVLLLIHGIIGDTEDMAAGIKAAGVADRFDLVLTYDYENLGTPIGDTADALEKALKGVGIGAGDGKMLTIIAHSMGGLVARWGIEQGGGKGFVDHLVMCGTPNNGSPFGRIGSALAIVGMLGDLAANTLPAAIPFVAPIKAVLKAAGGLTPTLEQLNPASQFILDLNASDDPGVRYTILAGDIDAYAAGEDAFFGRLLASTGRSAAFDLVFENQPNDIAVGVESIRAVGGVRATPPVRTDVACHHLNYFSAGAGRAALQAIDWQ